MRPIPEPVEELNKQFWAHCSEERLCFQMCIACGKWRHLPRPVCAECGSTDWQWAESSGRGKVFSWTVTRVPLHPAFAAKVPYAVVVVEMEEEVKLVAGLKDCPFETIELGMPVEVVFERLTESVIMPFFRPARQ